MSEEEDYVETAKGIIKDNNLGETQKTAEGLGEDFEKALEKAEQESNQGKLSEDELIALRAEVEKLQRELKAIEDEIERKLKVFEEKAETKQ